MAHTLRLGFCCVAVIIAGAVGCGGQVVREGGTEAGGSGGSSAGSGGRSGGGSGGIFHEEELEPCQKGQPQTAGAPCPWLADDLCYSTKDEACACICPPGPGSTCMSGLPSDFEPVDVSCF